MEDEEEPLTHTCNSCGSLIHYKPCHVPEGTFVPIVNCPKCGTFIRELQGTVILAFQKPEK
jgi:hypothetical protein